MSEIRHRERRPPAVNENPRDAIMESGPACPQSAVWMGDFNMEPGSAEYLRLTGQTPYHPHARYAHGLVDAVASGRLTAETGR